MICRRLILALAFLYGFLRAAVAATDWSLDPRYLGTIPGPANAFATSDDGMTLYALNRIWSCSARERTSLSNWDVGNPRSPRRLSGIEFPDAQPFKIIPLPQRHVIAVLARKCPDYSTEVITLDVAKGDLHELGRAPLSGVRWREERATPTGVWLLDGTPWHATGRIDIDASGRPHMRKSSALEYKEPVRPRLGYPIISGRAQLGNRPVMGTSFDPDHTIVLTSMAELHLSAREFLDLNDRLSGATFAQKIRVLKDAGIEDPMPEIPETLRPQVAELLERYAQYLSPFAGLRVRTAELAPTPARLFAAAAEKRALLSHTKSFEDKATLSRQAQRFYQRGDDLSGDYGDGGDSFVARNVGNEPASDICSYITAYKEMDRFTEIVADLDNSLAYFPAYGVIIAYNYGGELK
jgi:hypothetical protein